MDPSKSGNRFAALWPDHSRCFTGTLVAMHTVRVDHDRILVTMLLTQRPTIV